MDWLDIQAQPPELMNTIQTTRHSYYPVCDGSLDRALGIVQAKDMLDQAFRGQSIDLRAVMLEATVLPETSSVLSVLEKIKHNPIHMGFVVDEYGVLEGIVTELDILESIVGELPDDEPDTVPVPSAPVRDGSIVFDGAAAVDEVKTDLDIAAFPGEDTYHTLGGIALGQIGRIPRVGDGFTVAHWRFEVSAMEGRRVHQIVATFVPPVEEKFEENHD